MSDSSFLIRNHFLSGYSVDHDTRELRLRSVASTADLGEATEIVFTGVSTYHFFHDSFQTVLESISETDPEKLAEENWSLFEEGKSAGWPGSWAKSLEAAKKHFAENGIHAWVLDSKNGLRGWVLAKTATTNAMKPAATTAQAVDETDLLEAIRTLSEYAMENEEKEEGSGLYERKLEDVTVAFKSESSDRPESVRIYKRDKMIAWVAFADDEIVGQENSQILLEKADLARSK